MQKRLLDLLRDLDGEGHTYKDLMHRIGASSTSQVFHHLEQLQRKGLLKRDPDNPQLFRVIDDAEPEFSFLKLLALASAGHGIDNEQHVVESIPVRSSFIPTNLEDSYLVRAEGDSMEPKIHHKDIVLVEAFVPGRHNPNDKIVICTYHGETRIKRYTQVQNHIILESFNEKYPPIVIEDPDEFVVNGIVRGTMFSRL